MAFLTHGPGLKLSQAQQFKSLYGPGQSAPVTGIYQCQGCGFEIVRAATKLLQSRNDRTMPGHPKECRQISWRLVAQVEERPHLLANPDSPQRG